jgi:nitrogen-specific signal transduction histidine kinase
LKRVCAWCGDGISEDLDGDGLISHGICLPCADKLFFDQAVSLQTIIDKLPIPVLVMESDVTVSMLNRKAREILAVAPEQAAHRSRGDLFDCVYSNLPGGCGRTLHCAGCALRRAITATYETGEPQVLVPASMKKTDPDDPSAVTLTITTIKRDNLVIVKLDNVE